MGSIVRAVSRARYSILTVGATYVLSAIVGIAMVTWGNTFALDHRDRLVGDAVKNDAIVTTNFGGGHLQAAFMDFGANLIIGSVPTSLMGMAIVFPYPLVAYQGWIGGIVSVRGDHSSRLNTLPSATYFALTLLLQIIAYSVSIGAGVNTGVALLRPRSHYQGAKVLRIFPKEALLDWGRLYLVAIPIFLIASLWEFLSPWNF